MGGVNIEKERFNTIINEQRRNIAEFITRRPVVADLQLLAGAIAGAPGRVPTWVWGYFRGECQS